MLEGIVYPNFNANVDWTMTNEHFNYYQNIFNKVISDGEEYLSGPTAKGIFVKSGLPNPILGQIWSLCDSGKLGKLSLIDFCLAMHIIYLCRQGVPAPNSVPTTLASFLKLKEAQLKLESAKKKEMVAYQGEEQRIKEIQERIILEEKKQQELLRQQEEARQQEILRKQQEEYLRHQEFLKQQERERQEEELRQQQLKQQEEERRQKEEFMRQKEELQRQKEEYMRQQENLRQQAILKNEEIMRQQENLKKQQEYYRQQEEIKRQQEEQKQQDFLRQQQEIAREKELLRQKQEELRRQEEYQRQQVQFKQEQLLKQQQEEYAKQQQFNRYQEQKKFEEEQRLKEEILREKEAFKKQQELFLKEQEDLKKHQELQKIIPRIMALIDEKTKLTHNFKANMNEIVRVQNALINYDQQIEHLRKDANATELEVEKAKVKSLNIKDMIAQYKQQIAKVTAEKNEVASSIHDKQQLYALEERAAAKVSDEISENRKASLQLKKKIEKMAALIEKFKLRDKLSQGQVDPHLLQQKLFQEKIKQEMQSSVPIKSPRLDEESDSESDTENDELPPLDEDFALPQNDFDVPSKDDDFAIPSKEEDFTMPSTDEDFATPPTGGFESQREQDDFVIPSKEDDFVAPSVDDDFATPFNNTQETKIDNSRDFDIPPPDNDFDLPQAENDFDIHKDTSYNDIPSRDNDFDTVSPQDDFFSPPISNPTYEEPPKFVAESDFFSPPQVEPSPTSTQEEDDFFKPLSNAKVETVKTNRKTVTLFSESLFD